MLPKERLLLHSLNARVEGGETQFFERAARQLKRRLNETWIALGHPE
jgi:hypothetical protein